MTSASLAPIQEIIEHETQPTAQQVGRRSIDKATGNRRAGRIEGDTSTRPQPDAGTRSQEHPPRVERSEALGAPPTRKPQSPRLTKKRRIGLKIIADRLRELVPSIDARRKTTWFGDHFTETEADHVRTALLYIDTLHEQATTTSNGASTP